MNRRAACLFGLLATATGLRPARAADDPDTPNGDLILLRAASADGLHTYSVPVHFDVHMHRPVGVRAGVEAIAYYEAPSHAKLAITKIPGIIGGLFKGSYQLDMVPQTWPAKYVVNAVSRERIDGAPVYILDAAPRVTDVIYRVLLSVTQTDYLPVAATWYYRDKSSIRLSLSNRRVSGFMLPGAETIAVEMPKFGLDAVGRYGDYALNAPLPDSVFGAK